MATAVAMPGSGPKAGPVAGAGRGGRRRQQPDLQTRVAAVTKPNEDEYRAKEDELQKKISEIQSSVTKIQEQIKGKRGGLDEFSHKRQEIHQRLDELSGKIRTLEEERTALLEQIQQQQEHSRYKRNQALTLRKELPYESEEQIDQQLLELERYMITTSVSLKAEKELVKKMEQLRHMKPLVRDYSQLERDAADSNSIVPMRARLDMVRDELSKLQEMRRAESARNQQLIEERNKKTAPVQEFLDQRNELNTQLTALRKSLSDMRMEKSQQQKQYTAYLQELRNARRDAERQERKKQDLETKKERVQRNIEDLELQEGSIPGMQLLQQTVGYVKKLVDEATAAPDAEKEPESSSPAPAEDLDKEYSQVLKPKGQREEEFYLPPTSKKNKKKQRKTTQRKTAAISHDLHVLSDFATLGVDPPLTYADADECLATLHKKLGALEDKRSEFEAANQKKKDELAAQLADLERQSAELEKAELEAAAALAAGRASKETDEGSGASSPKQPAAKSG